MVYFLGRTNIDLSKLKEMKFKVPAAPVPGKATAKRQTQNAGIPRLYGGGIKPRQSTIVANVRSDPKPNSSVG